MYKSFLQFLYVILLCRIVLACNSNSINKSNSNNNKIDSISIWIDQSKNKSIDIKIRKESLAKSYRLNNYMKNDSVKNKNLLKITFQAYLLNDTLFFKKTNKEAQDLSIKLRDTFGIADTHWNYGNFYSKTEVMDSSYYHYYLAYQNFLAISHEYYAAKMLYNMAFIQGRVKDYSGSEISIFLALEKFKKLNKKGNIYRCYNQLGLIYLDLKEYDNAIFYYKKAIENIVIIDEKNQINEKISNNLGLVYQKQKRFKKAIEQFSTALNNLNLKSQNSNQNARLIDNLAYTKFLNGDTTNVSQELYTSLKIRDSINYISGVIISKLHLSEYYAYATDTTKAITYAKEANRLATTVNNNRDILASLQLLAKIDKANTDVYLENYISLNDSLQTQERKLRNKFTRIRFETDEYIEETEKLSQKISVIVVISAVVILIMGLLYAIKRQHAKNKELTFEKEQQKSNEEIVTLHLKQQSNLEEGRLKERHRIAEELHDGILGKIFGTRLGLGFLNLKGDTDTLAKHEELIEELQEVEKEIRNISHELKNELFASQQHFMSLVEDLIKKKSEIGNFEYVVTCNKEVHWNKINGNIKINCYRIIQEALQNTNKHAKATFVNIDFSINKKTLVLVIKDNGIGFDKMEKKKGIGVKNIQSRSQKIKAKFAIISSIDKGTILTFLIPI